jgi:hypothetical protein
MYLMAKELTLDEIDENEPDGPNQLRQFAERAAAKGARADALERELAAVKLGIDVDSRMGQAWLRDFKGDFSDAAAVLADATEFNPSIIKGAAAPAPIEVQAAEGAEVTEPVSTEAQQRTALADGAIPSGGAEQDIPSQSLDLARKSIDQGGTVVEAMGGLVNMRARAVAEGKMSPLLPNGQRPQR